jgi:hypothetical protein
MVARLSISYANGTGLNTSMRSDGTTSPGGTGRPGTGGGQIRARSRLIPPSCPRLLLLGKATARLHIPRVTRPSAGALGNTRSISRSSRTGPTSPARSALPSENARIMTCMCGNTYPLDRPSIAESALYTKNEAFREPRSRGDTSVTPPAYQTRITCCSRG